jgi:tRNA A37 threonylcarbamoyladenosine modification protein TsaB
MFLLLNGATEDASLILGEDTGKVHHMALSRKASLLEQIVMGLEYRRRERGDISGIGVVLGTGSFTATRIAVVTANILAYSCSIPVAGITPAQFADVRSAIEQVKQATVGDYVVASYSAEPRIGAPAVPTH